ncbi:MAG: ABC transporter permease, partial [Flavisolibacter sp.]|nr:ABC transporter permease [Flavisolibacter sp.]
MFRNYFKTAFRSLQRYKSYSIINILGLAIGIAVCLIIFLIVQFELSFDRFHTKKDRIYRVLTQFNDPTGVSYSAGVPFPLPRALKNDFPQLEQVAAIYGDDNTQIQVLNESGGIEKKFKEETGVFFTQPSFFEIFDFTWLSGSPATALAEPNSAVLTKETADKYFGNWKEAIGKTFKRNNGKTFKVTGILDDVPKNTDFQFKVIGSYNTLNSSTSDDWVTVSSNNMCYLLLPQSLTPAAFNKQLVPFVKKYMPADRTTTAHVLQPLSQVHYDSETSNFLQRTVSKQLISTLNLIALFILLIACVNFINLSTAQSINRAKEVGIRKVVGSNRMQLALQYLSETALITVSAVIIALGIVLLALPFIKTILNLPLSFSLTLSTLLFLTVVTIAVILLSGLYPALMLSRYNPIHALKARIMVKTGKGITLRKGLVVAQFVIAQALIIGTLIVVKQMHYFQNASLGFDKDAILTVPIPSDSAGRTKIDFLKEKLLQHNGIKAVSFGFASPSDRGNWYSD